MITLFGPPEPTLLEKLKDSVSKTRSQLAESVETLLAGERRIDPALLAELETALLRADLGPRTTREILDAVKEKVDRHALTDGAQLKTELKSQLVSILHRDGKGDAGASSAERAGEPRVTFIVGVNGTGKTTTIGKLANRLRKEGHSVVLCAADTFRAAAIEQLAIWAERNGVQMIRQKPGADPAAVVYDAVAAAKARGTDVVLVDTAGRLHTKSNLMQELEKMKRTAAKLVPGAPHDILLVMDATTGQNGLNQAREFTGHVGVTGIVLTKLDGTAKGGIVVAIARELGLPIRFVGVGEKLDDLVPFDAQTFVDSLFE
ncbi:MAG TPA: signal recognition particle-docking protein FtsY [Candidatus Acidoferrales bacterium]|jgi:fused signal recognition particle receptor|nr:signal recognition particle-docking protein FtsY [Candidatus Acidoferrales bacterium]